MAAITLTGTPADTCGDLPPVGQPAPDFSLVMTDLSEVHLKDFAGQKLVLSIFLGVDTDTCPLSVRRFDEELAKLSSAQVLNVSLDQPFTLGRFLRETNLHRVKLASCFRDPSFARNYGVEMINGPLKGMLARAVVVIDEKGTVQHTQLVSEINDEPDYEAVLNHLRQQ